MVEEQWLSKVLASGHRCVHIVPMSRREVERLPSLLADLGQSVAEVDGTVVNSENDLFRAIADGFCFPGYFGANWDALDECLRDLQWLPSDGYVILLAGADALWRRSPGMLMKLMDAVVFSARHWDQVGTPMNLVIEGSAIALAFTELLSEVEVHPDPSD